MPLLRLPFGMVGADQADAPVALTENDERFLQTDAIGGDGRLQVAVGTDNPYFDLRPRGSPGGIGYYRLDGHYQLADDGKTGLSLAFRGITPAGLDSDGVGEGPTIFIPAFAWYHELDTGTAIQGFVGKNFRANSRWGEGLHQSVHYGMAFQQPLCAGDDGLHGLNMFVEALGRYRCSQDYNQQPSATMELLPGLNWRGGENWWLSGALVFPVGSPHVEGGLWQVTCSWRF